MARNTDELESMTDEEIKSELKYAGSEKCDCGHVLKNHTFDMEKTMKGKVAVSDGCKYCSCEGYH